MSHSDSAEVMRDWRPLWDEEGISCMPYWPGPSVEKEKESLIIFATKHTSSGKMRKGNHLETDDIETKSSSTNMQAHQ